MIKIIKLLVILLFIASCTKPKKIPPLKLKEVSIENITIDSLLRNEGWHISHRKKLYYPQYEDSGYHYIVEYYKDSLHTEVHFHIIKQDTFIFNSGEWYPQNLNLITNKQ